MRTFDYHAISFSGPTAAAELRARNPGIFRGNNKQFRCFTSELNVRRISNGGLWLGVNRWPIDLYKSPSYTQAEMKSSNTSVRTSLDIPTPLHRKLHEAAVRRGCSARQLILRSIERLVAEELPDSGKHVRLPLVPATGRKIRPVTNDEAIFS
jgi:hypothetical protein